MHGKPCPRQRGGSFCPETSGGVSGRHRDFGRTVPLPRGCGCAPGLALPEAPVDRCGNFSRKAKIRRRSFSTSVTVRYICRDFSHTFGGGKLLNFLCTEGSAYSRSIESFR